MAPLACALVGYRVSHQSIQDYRDLPQFGNRSILQDLESRIGLPLALACVEHDEDDRSDYYICCLADYSGRPYDCEELLAIPVPPVFHQPIPVEGDLRRLTSLIRRDSRVNGRGLSIGVGHVTVGACAILAGSCGLLVSQ